MYPSGCMATPFTYPGKTRTPPGWQGQDGRIREFYRAIRLPGDVRSDGTSAYYANGSLTVKIPKNRPVVIEVGMQKWEAAPDSCEAVRK